MSPPCDTIEHGEDHAAAIEVVTRAGMALALGAEQLGVERGGLVEVRHLDGDAEHLGDIGLFFPFCVRLFDLGSTELGHRARPAGAHVFVRLTGSRLREPVAEDALDAVALQAVVAAAAAPRSLRTSPALFEHSRWRVVVGQLCWKRFAR